MRDRKGEREKGRGGAATHVQHLVLHRFLAFKQRPCEEGWVVKSGVAGVVLLTCVPDPQVREKWSGGSDAT